nr:hypothetical protein [Tanacetum cinerariifolium]
LSLTEPVLDSSRGACSANLNSSGIVFLQQWELSLLAVGTSSGNGNFITGSGNALQVNTARPKAVINRRNWVNDIKASACWVWKPIKPNSASIILKKYDYVDVRGTKLEESVRKKRSRGLKSIEVVDYILQVKKKLLTKKLEDSEAEHQV